MPTSARVRRRFVLMGLDGPYAGQQWEFSKAFRVGRDPQLELAIDDVSIDGCHARFFPTRDGWEVADLGSAGGTHLNGGLLNEGSWPLRRRDLLWLGDVALRVEGLE